MMSYISRMFIGGGFTVKAGQLACNPLIDSYTFEKEQDGVVYRWTGVRPEEITKDGDLVFHLPEQQVRADGGPYIMECGTELAWANP